MLKGQNWYHWPKMHDRQPSFNRSRGFGVVRVYHFYPFRLIFCLVDDNMRFTLEF
ncbi:hypothetical protein Hanom_Chr16g01434441 [Helianthus anomalus]